MSKKIHKLSPELIAQIAAGEVIERPVFAVKEILDNAIDAGSTKISISLNDYGFKKIMITDNGIGMSREDLLVCWQIHTTSKIENSNELLAIKSLGFRGEALASIAAVAELKIKSRRASDVGGFEVHIKNGKLLSSGPVGMPVGTVVEISNIFSSIPARKKFLKSPLLEFRKIIDTFLSFTLSYPEISFDFSHNDKRLYDLNAESNLEKRLELLISPDIIQNLVPIEYEDSYLKVSGFLGKPQISTKSQNKQFVFINGRRVFDHLTAQSLRDAYGSLLSSRQFPIAYLFISVPFEMVDVNIHPRKEQVAFFNPQFFYDTLFKATKEFLSNNNLNLGNVSFKKGEITDIYAGQILKSETDTFKVKDIPWVYNYNDISQVYNLYIILPGNNGVSIFDQHAMHERILFEEFKDKFKFLKQEIISLSKPIVLNLSVSEKILLESYIKDFKKMGLIFDLRNYSLKQIPKIFKDRDLSLLIKEMLEDLEIREKLKDIDDINLSIIKFLSCKEAVKAGDKLSKTEMTRLVKQLEKTPNNMTCPHGRPTRINFSLSEMNIWFKRF